MRLQKVLTASGNWQLLRVDGASGWGLARECCCGSSSSSSSSESSDSSSSISSMESSASGPVGGGDCDCSPPLDARYDVTLSGFPESSTWYAYNGTWTVEWIEDCTWYGEYDVLGLYPPDLFITLRYDDGNDWWEVIVSLPGGCSYEHHLVSTNPCVTRPAGTYTQAYINPVCPSNAPRPLGVVVI